MSVVSDASEVPSVAEESGVDSKDDKPSSKDVKHPSTAVMVQEALKSLKNKKGSHLQSIQKYIADKYSLNPTYRKRISKYINNAVIDGKNIQQIGDGSSRRFRLLETKTVSSKNKPKSAAVPKKAKGTEESDSGAPKTKSKANQPRPPVKASKTGKGDVDPAVKQGGKNTAGSKKAAPALKPASESKAKKSDETTGKDGTVKPKPKVNSKTKSKDVQPATSEQASPVEAEKQEEKPVTTKNSKAKKEKKEEPPVKKAKESAKEENQTRNRKPKGKQAADKADIPTKVTSLADNPTKS